MAFTRLTRMERVLQAADMLIPINHWPKTWPLNHAATKVVAASRKEEMGALQLFHSEITALYAKDIAIEGKKPSEVFDNPMDYEAFKHVMGEVNQVPEGHQLPEYF